MPGRSWRAGKAIAAMESPKALMCPLEKGDRGIEIGHQMPGRSWRAGKAIAAMESPKAVIAPLKRGSGELIVERGASGFGTESQ